MKVIFTGQKNSGSGTTIETWGDLVNITEFLPIPTTDSTFTYNGNIQSPVWQNYDPNKMVIGGTQSAINAGEYVTTFMLNYGYAWEDGTSGTKKVKWEIEPAPTLAEVWGDERVAGDTAWWGNLQKAITTSTREQRVSCLGKKKKVTLTSPVLGTTTHYVRCIGYDCDGDKTLTFQTMNCLANATPFMTQDEYNEFGSKAYWTNGTSDSIARKLCKDYYNAFPGKNVILTINKRYCITQDNNNNVHDNDSTAIYPETVFLPSENEMGWTKENIACGANTGYASGKNEFAEANTDKIAYQYYTSDDKRVKYLGTDNDPEGKTSGGQCYWKRSLCYYSISPNRISSVETTGVATDVHYSSPYGLAPAFVIG